MTNSPQKRQSNDHLVFPKWGGIVMIVISIVILVSMINPLNNVIVNVEDEITQINGKLELLSQFQDELVSIVSDPQSLENLASEGSDLLFFLDSLIKKEELESIREELVSIKSYVQSTNKLVYDQNIDLNSLIDRTESLTENSTSDEFKYKRMLANLSRIKTYIMIGIVILFLAFFYYIWLLRRHKLLVSDYQSLRSRYISLLGTKGQN